jgi:hypothetical protein
VPPGLLRRLVLAAGLALAAPSAHAQSSATPEDFLRVLVQAPWPLQILAYCYSEVERDPGFQETGRQWNARNAALYANVEKLSEAMAIPPEVRQRADEASLAAIRDTVARQGDKPGYCHTIARVIDSGAYDIDQRKDLQDALKRIFGRD